MHGAKYGAVKSDKGMTEWLDSVSYKEPSGQRNMHLYVVMGTGRLVPIATNLFPITYPFCKT